jgi:predicted alpha/beta hydrolase
MKKNQSKSEGLALMVQLVSYMVRFMHRAGMKRTEIESCLLQCIGGPLESARPRQLSNDEVVSIGCDTVAGAVLREWHRNPALLV